MGKEYSAIPLPPYLYVAVISLLIFRIIPCIIESIMQFIAA